ncbi:MAG: FMN-binding protein [Polaribacter sp.]
MTLKRFLFFTAIVFSLLLTSFTIPNQLQKKVYKEIKKTFGIDDFQTIPVLIDQSINKKLSKKIRPKNLYTIQKEGAIIGYAFVDKAPSKTDEFDYLILLDANLIIKKTKVLMYREDYGGEIGSTRWLKQFIGKKPADTLQYEKEIIAISGATISANSMTIAINQFLQNLKILHTNKVL